MREPSWYPNNISLSTTNTEVIAFSETRNNVAPSIKIDAVTENLKIARKSFID